eukprot:g558.t1
MAKRSLDWGWRLSTASSYSPVPFVQGKRFQWEAILGVEIHARLSSGHKLFSPSPTPSNPNLKTTANTSIIRPNSQLSLFDAALPGTLPTLNNECVDLGILTCLSLASNVNQTSHFDRKHYFYPDLPHGYQITQRDHPIGSGGNVNLQIPHQQNYNTKELQKMKKTAKKTMNGVSDLFLQRSIGLIQVQLEMDSGKSLHDFLPSYSLIDLNRAGMPLMEIVSKPELRSPLEAGEFLKKIQLILRTIETSEANMEDGSLRCDLNVNIRSINPVTRTEFTSNVKGESHSNSNSLGNNDSDHIRHSTGECHDFLELVTPRVEVKNMNSVRAVVNAGEFEINRAMELVENLFDKNNGDLSKVREALVKLPMETRMYDGLNQSTIHMRYKETNEDYRYFPDPDLPRLCLSDRKISDVQRLVPELPDATIERLTTEKDVGEYEAWVLVNERGAVQFFEECCDTVLTTKIPQTLESKEKNREGMKVESSMIAKWLVNALFGRLHERNLDFQQLNKPTDQKAQKSQKDEEDQKNQKDQHDTLDRNITPEWFVELVYGVANDMLSGPVAKRLIDTKLDDRDEQNQKNVGQQEGPLGMAKRLGVLLEPMNETDLENLCRSVLEDTAFTNELEKVQGGNKRVKGFFVGQVVKRSKGKGNPKAISFVIDKILKEMI